LLHLYDCEILVEIVSNDPLSDVLIYLTLFMHFIDINKINLE
jgi:hypothetical protein